MPQENQPLARCKKQIESKLGWGNADTWQSQDFENLSHRIFEETNRMLSGSTLKRIWGKVRYESNPNRATLDVLAQFLGYTGWLEFVNSESAPIVAPADPKQNKRSLARLFLPWLGFLGLLLLVVVAIPRFLPPHQDLYFQNVAFNVRMVTSGLPNTVVFTYDVSQSNADSVFIQLSWDNRSRFKVDKALNEYTSTYYLPGYYHAKLILNDSTVKEQDVFIPTDGWTGIIMQNPTPIYLNKQLFADRLALTKTNLSELGVNFEREPPILDFYLVSDTINAESGNMHFEAEVQNTYEERNGICRKTTVLLMGSKGVISIPLSKKGCVGELGLMLGSRYINGKTHDLSGFGVDFSNPVRLSCTTGMGRVDIAVDDHAVFSDDFAEDIGQIVGLQIRFIGTGFIQSIRLE
ncbi:MAG: hypothetical protein KDC59_05615 [Saprospiraceae bacterium]|nr:hypothetical protein [Saprospiraceae bacterium]HPG05941.1 hypothetical protein [Saprospiraceae bacterium]